MTKILLTALVLAAACGDDGNKAIDAAPKPIDAPPIDIDARDIDAPGARRGPETLDLTGGANGLLWDNATSTLFLTDNNSDELLKFTDTGNVEIVGALPPGSAGISLGDMVKRADGSILVANFGFGTQGTVFKLIPGQAATSLTGLDPVRRRIGMSQDGNAQLYVAYFINAGMMMQAGGVSSIALAGDVATETEIAGTTTNAGFRKLVGLVATNDAVFVTDQTQKKIFKIAIPGNAVTEVAPVPSADMLAIMPNGDLLTGGGNSIHRVTQAGTVTELFAGEFEQVRGIAFDPTAKRIFVIDHSATVGTPDKLQIRPLDN
ncbi:MAG: hypothetical protein KIT31_20405 [Deltaproteobacteria bacterium]|nr:hypothetical protein [Deltaproteobacteria bacterium]